jgi:hypothetical protein
MVVMDMENRKPGVMPGFLMDDQEQPWRAPT